MTGIDNLAIPSATLIASSTNSAAGTTRLTNPDLSASAASIIRPVRTISIALDLPTNRGNLCVPPAPGIIPNLISGCPNWALSAAIIKSHIIANSHPPPKAKPDTAAITGFLQTVTFSQPLVIKSSIYALIYVLGAISLISAPAAKAFSDPVKTTHLTSSFFSKSSNA